MRPEGHYLPNRYANYTYVQLATEFIEVKNGSGFITKLQIGVFLNCVILKIKTTRIYKWTRCKQHRCENLKYRWTYHVLHTQHGFRF
jgi:hypothetical protein